MNDEKLCDGRVSFLFNWGENPTRIEVIDKDSGVRALEILLDDSQLAMAMGRLGHTPCKLMFAGEKGLSRIGKVREVITEEVPLPKATWNRPNEERAEMACAKIRMKYEGRDFDMDCGGSRKSFFFKDPETGEVIDDDGGDLYAKVIVWVWEEKK